MSTKQIVQDLLEKLPEDVTLHDIAQEIEFIAGVCKGLGEIERGERTPIEEIEAELPQLSPEELAELERFVRMARRGTAEKAAVSAFDLPPLDLGKMLRPLGDREEWYDEMLEGRV